MRRGSAQALLGRRGHLLDALQPRASKGTTSGNTASSFRAEDASAGPRDSVTALLGRGVIRNRVPGGF